MKALQEKNKYQIEENAELKDQLRNVQVKFRALEDKFNKEKDKWHKELLSAMGYGSEREQQLKQVTDELQQELAQLKDSKAKLELSLSKQTAESKRMQSLLDSARDRNESTVKEIQNLRVQYEAKLEKLCEYSNKLENRLHEFEFDTKQRNEQFDKVI